jgi:hypothetical protein
LDNVTITQDLRVSRAQAHFDAVQAHVDTTQIGPAQIAVDMNANASKSVQDVFAAQLSKATASGDVTVGAAQKNLASITDSATSLIQGAQNNSDAANNAATLAIATAQGTLSNTTNFWNNVIAGDEGNLSNAQGQAGIDEGVASGAAGVANARANTQYAGGAPVVNIYGLPTTDANQIATEVGWVLRPQIAA